MFRSVQLLKSRRVAVRGGSSGSQKRSGCLFFGISFPSFQATRGYPLRRVQQAQVAYMPERSDVQGEGLLQKPRNNQTETGVWL